MSAESALSRMIAAPELTVAPGIYDALGGVLAEQAGFGAAYLSGASIAYCRYGRPDVGLVGMSEVAATLAAVKERVDLPVIVDADTGFGNALNVMRTVRLFERNGAAAIQIEDQTLPKRCGHLRGKTLVSKGEMVGKIKAALDARRDPATLIIARSDAIAVEGIEAALDRAEAYAQAGADVLFVEAPQSRDEMGRIVERLGGQVPLLANMVNGGTTPMLPSSRLHDLGFSVAIFPAAGFLAAGAALETVYGDIKANGTTTGRAALYDFGEFSRLIGFEQVWAFDRRYA